MRGTESRLMSWQDAVESCQAIWDLFEQKFADEIAPKIAIVETFIEDNRANPQMALRVGQWMQDVENMKRCRDSFKDTFKRTRDANEQYIENHLLGQKKRRRRLDFVSTRNPKGLIRFAPNERKKHRTKGKKRKNAAPPGARKHVRTGRPRGWNLRKYVHAKHRGGRVLTITARRQSRRFRRQGFRIAHRANNLVRSARPLVHPLRGRKTWKAYPLHRFEKREGWLAAYLDGK